MAEFRRLISYIYEYEGRAKGKNVGFVKLETRNGMCRLSVNVKNLYIGSSDMGVYLMSGRKEIFLGNMFLRNGCGEFRTMVQVADVQESGETMDECYGLTIHGKGESWRVYTTIWEDAIAQAAQLTLESVTSEAVLENEVEKGKLSSVVPQAEKNTEREQAGERAAAREKDIHEGTREAGRKAGLQKMAVRAGTGEEGENEGTGRGERIQESEGRSEDREEEGEIGKESRDIWDKRQEVLGIDVTRNGTGAARNGRKTWPVMNFRPAISANARQFANVNAKPLADMDVKLPTDESAGFPENEKAGRETPGEGLGQPQQNRMEDPGQLQGKPSNAARDANIPDFEMGRLEVETEHPDIPLGQIGRQEKIMPVPGAKAERDWGYRATGQTGRFPEEPGRGDDFPNTPEGNGRFQGDAGQMRPTFLTETGQMEAAPVIRQHKEEPLIVGDPEALAKLDAEEALENQIPVWDFFSKTYPKIQAFDSEYGCQVLVIKPQDIGLLPREVWIYGNNSFLLHGYYNYRYLILARLENPKGAPRYLLGIPGHYYSNEKYMASMFGFPHFVLSKKQPSQDGRFGYWYTDIRMGDGTVPGNMAARRLRAEGE